MRKSMLWIAGVAIMAFAAAGAQAADKKVLAVVVKGLDNPFFEQVHLGCEKWTPITPTATTPACTPARPRAPMKPAKCRSSAI